MHRTASTITILFATAIISLTLSVPVSLLGQSTAGILSGTAVDASDGVLPGVSVSASSPGGRALASTVTDGRGEFVLRDLPVGNVVLEFRLSGFEDARVNAVVPSPASAATRSDRIVQRMTMPARAESVTVVGDPPPPPPPPPRPTAAPVPDHDQAAVCGPSKADGPEPAFGTIRSRNDDESKRLFAAGDVLLVDVGSGPALTEGQNFIVRRRYPTALRYGRNLVVMGEHSSGLLQIVDVDDEVATGVVVYACDEMMRGDYLVPLDAEAPRPPDPAGPPDFDDAARILFADAGQPLGVTGRMMILDRGGEDGVRVGQRLTLFRRSRFGDRRPLVVGHAVVVAVRRDSATFLVEHAVDAIFFGHDGDWAAPQRPARAAR